MSTPQPENLVENVPIGPQTTLKVGGVARYFAACESDEDIMRVLQWSREKDYKVLVLGAGSNVLVADTGFDGVVIRCTNTRLQLSASDDYIQVDAGAGVEWDHLVERCVAEKAAGVECLSGIPGLVGATPIQNIGAYGQEVSSTIVSVTGIDRDSLQAQVLTASDCGFGYRTSHFKTQQKSFIVTSVQYRLARNDAGQVEYPDLRRALGIDATSSVRANRPGGTSAFTALARANLVRRASASPTLAETRDAIIAVRRSKSMVISADDPNRRSAGSFFLNPILTETAFGQLVARVRRDGLADTVPSFAVNACKKVPAAWLIEQAGFKRGIWHGRAGLSSRHALAIINRGGASAADIISFAAHIRQGVQQQFAVTLHPEPVFVGFNADPDTLLNTGQN